MLRAPDKRLRYSKQHFQGYYLQLHAYLRKDSDTDDYLDGIFTNPITDLLEGHARELKKGADHRDETIMAVVTQLTSLYQEFQVAGGFPPTAEMLKEDPGFKQPKPTLMLEDNEACIAMVNNPVVSGRNKHVELRQHYVREQHRKGVIAMSYIKTAEQTADIFTKNLPKPTFEKHAHTLLAGLPPEGLQHGKRTAPT